MALQPSNGISWFVVRLGPVLRESPPSTRSNRVRPASLSLLHRAAAAGQSSDAARHVVPVQRRSPGRPSEVVFRPHHSRLMTPPAGPAMSAGPGPPPVPPRRPQSSLAPPLSRLWSSAIASVVCNVYPRPCLVLHQHVRSSNPPDLAGAAAPGAPPAPLPTPARSRRCQHVSMSYAPHAVGRGAMTSSKGCNLWRLGVSCCAARCN